MNPETNNIHALNKLDVVDDGVKGSTYNIAVCDELGHYLVYIH